MLTRIMHQCFLPVGLLALLWPSLGELYVRIGAAACLAGLWALQVNRSKYLRQAAYATASPLR
jgi:hypothetical protein